MAHRDEMGMSAPMSALGGWTGIDMLSLSILTPGADEVGES
jgi:hypothetical protein